MASLVKARLRRTLKERLKRLSKGERVRKSRRIQQALFRREFFRNAETILFYASLPSEVDTWPMMEQALKMRKRILIPSMQSGRIVPSEVRNPKKDLRRGSYGIFEPKGRSSRPVKPDEIDLVLVPGIGFDKRGFRLGRGGGHYDRFLKRLKGRVPVVGLAFKVQRVQRIPAASHDIPVDDVICA